MDFVQGLNVTIYGLGIVFLALLVVMFAIMVLSRIFAVATGKDFMAAPTQEAELPAPVEEIAPWTPQAVSPTQSSVPAVGATAASAFDMVVAGEQHKVQIEDAGTAGWIVSLDGQNYQVARNGSDARKIIVNGTTHTVEVRASSDGSASVLVDGVPQSVQIVRGEAPASAQSAAPAPAQAVAAPPAPAPAAAPRPASGEKVTAPLPGKVLSVAVKPGVAVRKGDELCVIEAMKMGNSIKAQRDSTIREVLVSVGDSVSFGAPLFVIG